MTREEARKVAEVMLAYTNPYNDETKHLVETDKEAPESFED